MVARSAHQMALLSGISKRILVGTNITKISMMFHHLQTLFARANGFLRSEHLMVILVMKMVDQAIL